MAKQLNGRGSLNKRGSPHAPSVWAGALSILLLVLIIAIRLLGDRLYDFPNNPLSSAIPPDAVIVCLAGGKFRVEAAYSLYAEGVGKQLFIVGAGRKSTPLGLARAHAGESVRRISEERFRDIHVETESGNTIENAFAVNHLLQNNPAVKTIVLVTSGYHMRRAELTIQHQLQRPVSILPFVPPSEAIQQANWWHTWLGIQVTVVEYGKFLLASLFLPQLSHF